MAHRIELDSYIQNYDSPLRISRLVAIAKSNSILSHEALRLAVSEALKGPDTALYKKLVGMLRHLDPDDPLATLNTEWIEKVDRENKQKTEQLEDELKQYKNNLIKESIRMGHEDLGNHYLRIGSYNMAAKSFVKLREFCQTQKHIADLNAKLLFLSIIQESWNSVMTYRLKLYDGSKDASVSTVQIDAIVQVATGLAYLNQNQFYDAALAFTSIDPIYMTNASAAGIDFARKVLTPNEVAIYGALCAFGTMTPKQLKTHVLENQKFRQFLELESHLRRAINMYCSNKFTACLQVLDSYAPDYKIDLYLAGPFNILYRNIRTRCLQQWFSAFSVATLDELSVAFPPTANETLPQELERLIQSKELDARIDLVDGLLVSPDVDQRILVINNTLDMSKAQHRNLRLRLHRINMQSGRYEVKNPERNQYDDDESGLRGATKRKAAPDTGASGSFMI